LKQIVCIQFYWPDQSYVYDWSYIYWRYKRTLVLLAILSYKVLKKKVLNPLLVPVAIWNKIEKLDKIW